MQTLLTKLFSYKAWANRQLFTTLQGLTQEKHPRQLHDAKRILNHVYVVDQIFAANLQRKLHGFNALNTSDTPLLAQLASNVAQLDQWYLNYLETLDSAKLDENISFMFVDGSLGNMTRAEMLMHVITHGNYHRGAVGRILVDLQMAPPPDTFTVFLHKQD